jgi:2-(1,2-epoxy-1,2-dihydrophenyl)acetyl-CoA isomerase
MTEVDTGAASLLARVEDGVGVLTMNRPERRNALDRPMVDALGRMLAAFAVDDAVGCVVLTGAGGAFCAGGDVKAMAEGDGTREGLDARIQRQRLAHHATSGALWSMPKPTIAALPGPAAGAGLALALACDLRYAAEGAILTTAFANVAFSGDFGGSWFLTHLVGPAKARELYFFADRIGTAEAADLGLLNGVFPAPDLDTEVLSRAHRLAAGPRIAYRYMKENLNRAQTAPLTEALDLEATYQLHTGLTQDHTEAAQAFVARRPPTFHGR